VALAGPAATGQTGVLVLSGDPIAEATRLTALIESDFNDYHFEYVGKMDLAKNYGVRILYRLGTRAA